MATVADHDRLHNMDGDGSPVDNNDASRGHAMPFTLLKLAYFACLPELRDLYNTKYYGISVDLQDCCNYLMAPGDRLRSSQPNDGGDELSVCSTAAFNGHVDCLQQAHVAGIPWSWRATEMACRTGHLECLVYLHKNGCGTGGPISTLAAACAGQLGTLEYAWANGFSFPTNLCTLIARFGSLESLRYLRSLGFGWDATTTAEAARYNQLAFLKYLRQHNCPWDATTCFNAAINGHIECLEYAHTNGCEWDASTCHGASENGHLECLIYAHTHGCEWDILTTIMAVVYKQPHCFRYAVERGCPWPSIWNSLLDEEFH